MDWRNIPEDDDDDDNVQLPVGIYSKVIRFGNSVDKLAEEEVKFNLSRPAVPSAAQKAHQQKALGYVKSPVAKSPKSSPSNAFSTDTYELVEAKSTDPVLSLIDVKSLSKEAKEELIKQLRDSLTVDPDVKLNIPLPEKFKRAPTPRCDEYERVNTKFIEEADEIAQNSARKSREKSKSNLDRVLPHTSLNQFDYPGIESALATGQVSMNEFYENVQVKVLDDDNIHLANDKEMNNLERELMFHNDVGSFKIIPAIEQLPPLPPQHRIQLHSDVKSEPTQKSTNDDIPLKSSTKSEPSLPLKSSPVLKSAKEKSSSKKTKSKQKNIQKDDIKTQPQLTTFNIGAKESPEKIQIQEKPPSLKKKSPKGKGKSPNKRKKSPIKSKSPKTVERTRSSNSRK